MIRVERRSKTVERSLTVFATEDFFCKIFNKAIQGIIMNKKQPVATFVHNSGEIGIYSFSPLDYNPFNTPEIASIWDEEFAAIGREAYEEEKEELLKNSMGYFGECFVAIVKEKGQKQKTVGISGYFPMNEEMSRFFLRWHGVRDEFKGTGLSNFLIKTVIERIEKNHPKAETLVEHMPDIESYKKIAEIFLKMGFSPLDSTEVYDWSPHPWREWEKPLHSSLISEMNKSQSRNAPRF